MRNNIILKNDIKKKLKELIESKTTFYFIGIGGCGMSSLAIILKQLGCKVKGSNLIKSIYTDLVERHDIEINFNHYITNIDTDIQAIVFSSAIPESNIEYCQAINKNIPIFHRSHILEYLISKHSKTIGVMGSHGKGSHCINLYNCLSRKYDCSYIIGGLFNSTNCCYSWDTDYLICEIDESDGSFLNLLPEILIITNIALDHVEYLKSIENFQNLLIKFINENKNLEKIYLNLEDENSRRLFEKIKEDHRICTFDLSNVKNIQLHNVINSSHSSFEIDTIKMKTPFFSKYNISNICNSLNISKSIGCELNLLSDIFYDFSGILNRSSLILCKDKTLIKNFAHDPDEIKLNLEDNIFLKEKIISIYEPFGSFNFFKNKKNKFRNCFENCKLTLIIKHNDDKINKILIDNIQNSIFFNTHDELYNYLLTITTLDNIFFFFAVDSKAIELNIFKIAENLQDYDNNKPLRHNLQIENIQIETKGIYINELINNLECQIYGKNKVILNLAENDKEITKGSLFFCQKGKNYDPNLYIDDIINRGCTCIVSENSPMTNKITWITTNNLLKLKADICYNFYQWSKKKIKIIGITGTNGKTSCCYIIKSLLEQNNKRVLYIGTLGYIFNNKVIKINNTTPSILEINKIINKYDCEYVVMEVSSHALVEYRVENLPFEIVALTNITQDHLDYHITMENYIDAKRKIFDLNSKYKIVNSKCKHLIFNNVLTYGKKENDNFKFSNFQQTNKFSLFNYQNVYQIKTEYIGEIYVENVILALACLDLLKIPIHENYIFPNVPGRLNQISNDPKVIIDFAHTPDALDNILKIVSNIILITGSGGDRDRSKRKLICPIVKKYTNKFIITSDNPRCENPLQICKDIQGENDYHIIVDRKEAIIHGLKNQLINETLVICGKGHEDYIIIGKTKYYYNDTNFVNLALRFLNKKILIIGQGISGTSAKELISNFTSEIDFYNDQKYNTYDYIIPSPSVPPQHPVLINSKNIIGEIELAYQIYSQCKWIAVTGSNGKTTTVSILGKMFKYLVGNIGIPCSSLPSYIEYVEPIIAEISSFQLMSIKYFKPKIAVILNINPNHLDYHQTFENYKTAKFQVTKNQDQNDILLVPSEEWAYNLKTKAEKIYFGKKLNNLSCIFLKNKDIILKRSNKEIPIFSINKPKLLGGHNLINLMVAGTISYLLNKPKDIINKALEDFMPLEHRLEKLNIISDINFYNDSKATTACSCLAALESINKKSNIILLMGGDPKGCNPYNIIFDYMKNNSNLRAIITFGSSTKLVKHIRINNLYILSTLEESVKKAMSIALKGDTILMSPACASWDQYKNYKDRGNDFKNIVKSLTG